MQKMFGVAVFSLGMGINIYSDKILQKTKEKLNK